MSSSKLAEEILKLVVMKLPLEMKLQFIKELCEIEIAQKEEK